VTIERTRLTRPAAATSPVDKPQASAKDVDYWLRVFGEDGSERE